MLMATVNASILIISLPAIFRGIHLDPLGSLVGDAEGRARLARSLEALPPEVVEDKQLAEISAVVLDWLSTQDAIG